MVGLGLGLGFKFSRGGLSSSLTTTLDLTAGVPADFTYARASVAWYRNSSGVWTQASSGTLRSNHYLDDLTTFGALFEPATTNKLTDRNAAPTDTTGWTKTGDAASVLSATTGPGTEITDAGLANIVSGNQVLRLDNTSGVTVAAMESTATFGNTNAHVISAWVYVVSGTATLTRTGAGTPETLTISANSGFVRYGLNIIPNATTDKMKIQISAGGDMYYSLGQIEENAFTQWLDTGTGVASSAAPTSPIVTNAATATRAADSMVDTAWDTRTWFSGSVGTLVINYAPLGFGPSAGQSLFAVSSGTASSGGTANYHSVRYNNTLGKWRTYTVGAGNVSTAFSESGIPRFNELNKLAYSWNSTTVTMLNEVVLDQLTDTAVLTEPTSLNRFRIGGNVAGSGTFFGIIKSLTFIDAYKSTPALGPYIFPSNSNVILYAGQSVAVGVVESVPTETNWGQIRALGIMETYLPGQNNKILNGAYGGSALLKALTAGADNWWLDDGGTAGNVVEWGPRYTGFEKQLLALKTAGVTNVVIVWNQANAGIPDTLTDGEARQKAGIINLYEKIVEVWGTDIWFLLEFESTRDGGAPNQRIRDIYTDLVADPLYPYFDKTPEIADVELYDTVHPTDLGYYNTIVPRTIPKALTKLGVSIANVDGPRVTAVTRVGLNVTVTIAHDGGTDFTPTTGIEGFFYFDDSTMIFNGATDTAARASATSITFTLPSTPTGVETIYWLYSGSAGVANNLMIIDNAARPLLLNGFTSTVPYSEVPDTGQYFTDDSFADPYFTDDSFADPYFTGV